MRLLLAEKADVNSAANSGAEPSYRLWEVFWEVFILGTVSRELVLRSFVNIVVLHSDCGEAMN